MTTIKNIKISMLAASVTILTACGGGGSSGGGVDNPPVPVTPVPVKGRAIDGPLAGATVVFDNCTSAATQTDEEGYFVFPENCSNTVLQVSGGIDTATGLPFEGILSAPAQGNSDVIISPISTLIQAQVASGLSLNAAIEKTSSALGISSNNLLSTDPMTNQTLYAKNATVQQFVKEISSVISSLQSSIDPEQIQKLTFSALSDSLSQNNQNLSDITFIQGALSTTLDAVKQQLPAKYQSEFNAVKQNLVALTANKISNSVQTVEKTLTELPATQFNAGTNSIKAATGSDLANTYNDLGIENLIDTFANLLTLNPTQSAGLFQEISSSSGNTTNTDKLLDTLEQLNDLAKDAHLDFALNDEIIQTVVEPNKFYSNYLRLDGFSIASRNLSAQQLTNALQTPISINNLDQLLVNVTAFGTERSQTKTIAAGLSIKTTDKQLQLEVDRLELSFNANGTLTGAVLPVGAKLTGTATPKLSLASQLTLGQAVNVLQEGKIALNTTTLGNISASLANEFKQIDFNGQTPTVTAVLHAPQTHVATVINNQPQLAANYSVSSTSYGAGVSTRFTISTP